MKKKFTFLLTALFLLVGSAKAAVTDLPEMSSGDDIKWYTISNTRSTSGKYLYWTTDGLKDANTLSVASLFYFTGTADACYIHSAATELLFSGTGAWTTGGTPCTISETPHSSKAGLAIGFNGTYLNEQNHSNGFTTWSANDAGSIFTVELVSDLTKVIDIAALKASAAAELAGLAQITAIFPDASAAIAELNAIEAAGTGLAELKAASNAINDIAIAYKASIDGANVRFTTFGRNTTDGTDMVITGSTATHATSSGDAGIWTLIDNGDGTFKMYNFASNLYLGATSGNSQNVAICQDFSEAAPYTFNPISKDRTNIWNKGNTLHADGWGNIVQWNPDNTTAEASIWSVVSSDPIAITREAYDAATTAAHSLPAALQDAYGIVAEYSSNAVEPKEGSLAALLDNDPNTFFHSTWSQSIEGTHYLQAEVSEPVKSFSFYFKKRSGNNDNRPTVIEISGSTDGTEFTPITTVSDLPRVATKIDYFSDIITTTEEIKHLRFAVKETNTGTNFFTFSEFYILPGTGDAAELAKAYRNFGSTSITNPAIDEYAETLIKGENILALSGIKKEIAAILAANGDNHSETPALGQYTTTAYQSLEEEYNDMDATRESLEAAIANFKASQNRPVYFITSAWSDGYSAGSAIYYDGAWKWAQANVYDKQMWMTIPGYTGEDIPATTSYDPQGTSYEICDYLTGTVMRDKKVQIVSIDGWEGAYNLQYNANGESTDAVQHAASHGVIVNWKAATTSDCKASAWYIEYLGNSYDLEQLTGEYKYVIPSSTASDIVNAEYEEHTVDNELTIYTSYCHWSNDLVIYNKPYKSHFYSNEQPYAIKTIQFVTNSTDEALVVLGSNDGESWVMVDEVSIASGKGIADFSGKAYNYFKVSTKRYNKVYISNMLINYDPTVELPLIVDEPAFNIAGGNLYEPAKLELSSEQGADIYWSTDGENYEAYDEEIEIDATCTIYAYAEIDGVESKVVSETYVVAAEYENIAAMQAAVEATEEGMPVVIDLQAIITEVGEKQISINDNTAELLVSDNYLPDYYAIKDTLCGKLRGVYKLVKGQPTVCELDYAYLSHKIFVLTEAPELEGQFFTVGNATSVLKEYTWYLLRNVNRNAYVNETDVDLRMLPTTSITSMSAADDNLGVLFHLEKSENGEDLYTICSGKGNYFTIAQSSSTISAAAVDYLIKNISGNTFYIQDPATGVVVDGNAAGGTFVGWGTTVPTGTNGNNVYQFMEVEFVDAEKAASIVKASGILNELQQEYGLVTDASQYSSNAVETTEGSLAALLDNDYTTFFHSSWSQTVEGTHYLQAEVSKPTKSLFFYFKKRSQNNNNRPTDITILGSNDGVNFTEVTRINSGLPTDAGTLDYTSSVIKATQAYKHFRFMVNATGGDTGNTQFFTFSEFYILPGESVYRNVITAANALLAAEITDKNFDKLVAAFEAAYAKLKGEDEKPPVTPTGKKVVYDLNVERITGMGYAADDHYITTDKLTALLGGKKLEGAAIWGVNPDGTYVADAMATYDGWRDADGAFAYWGESAVVCAKLFQEEGSYLVELCTFPANDPEAGTKYTASWALIAGQDTVVINTNITFVAPTVINIANYEVVATMKVEHNEAANTAYSGNTAAFDAAAAAKALGVASLDDAGQYILNVTTGDLVLNTTDGWRDNKGDAAGWGNAGGVCVKIQSPSTGSIDYIGCYDDTHAAGETYTAKWAFVSGNKAAIVEVVITFIDASSISDINVDQPVTAYTISGKAIQTTANGVKNLQRGIYIINGKKVYVK